MAGQLCQVHWTKDALATLGIHITPKFIDEALSYNWELFAKGLAGHVKAYVPFDKDAPGWTQGALGFFGKYSSTKDINFAPANAKIEKLLQNVDIFLRDKVCGKLLISLEGVAISNGRTGWFALACLNLLLQGKRDIEVFLFRAGKVAEVVILALNYGAATKIKHISVLSRGKKFNHELVGKLQSTVRFQPDAVNDRELLPKAQFVITATNSRKPVFETDEIVPNAVTLSLGIDDMPANYIKHVLAARGQIVDDDMVAMESRNVDALALYYSRRGMKLTQHGREHGIKNYTEVLANAALMEQLKTWEGPANFSPVGLASINVAIAARIYETLVHKLSGAFQ